MKHLIALICVAVIAFTAVFTVDAVNPDPASAAMWFAECETAELFGWNARWANTACYLAIKNDLFGGGWEGSYGYGFGGDGDDLGGATSGLYSGDGDSIAGASANGDADGVSGIASRYASRSGGDADGVLGHR